jgi:hypothetical protein
MLNVGKEVAVLKHMTVAELRAKYAEVFGEGTRSRHKEFLWKRIAWRMQSLAEGDLSERARRRAAELANDADIRMLAPKTPASPAPEWTRIAELRFSADRRLPMPGAVLSREYKDRTVVATVLPKGFEYEGQVYRSLSAVAKAVTGTHWNGYHFFGLTKGGDSPSPAPCISATDADGERCSSAARRPRPPRRGASPAFRGSWLWRCALSAS